ncbi:MAG: chromosome partitioning protein ParA [Rhodothermaceae bacterium]|nr:chromosome partitioning protein ParA [Rhodothermaceae bacterium]
MSDGTLQLLLAIRRRLQTAMRRQTAAEVAFGLVVTLGVLAAFLLVGVAVEAGFWMGIGLRSVFFWVFVVGALALLGYFVVWPVLRLVGVVPGLDERVAAERAGHRHPAVADRLTALLDLADGRASAAPTPLVDHALHALGRTVEPVPFERTEDLQPVRRIAPWALAPLLGLLFFLIAAPTTFVGAVDRLFAPATDFQPPAPFFFEVEPGDVELARGEALAVAARPVGTDFPPDAVLELGRADEATQDQIRLTLGEDGRFAHTVPNVRADLRYRITAEGVTSPWYEATVVTRPVVNGLNVSLQPPRYTGLRTRSLAPGIGDVLALPGTQIRVTVALGGEPPEEAMLLVNWSEQAPTPVSLTVEGQEATGVFTLQREGEYEIRLVDANGRTNQNAVRYRLATLRDAPPQITLVEGAENVLAETARRARFRITDDFGFARVSLFWRFAERRDGEAEADFRRVSIPLDAPRRLDQEVLTDWLPRDGSRTPQPGDVVEFYGEVRDNDVVSGYKAARTPVFTLRYPSLDEQYDQLDETQEETEDQLETIQDESEEFQERFEELRDELRRDPEPDWEDQRQLDQLMQQQESLQQQTEALTQQMENLLEQMQEGALVTEETMRLYEAMQQVMEELDSPELREALEMLRQAMEQMDMRQMMEALDEIEFNEEEFRERMERALELFERLQTAQELDEAARRAEDLAEREEALSEATERLQEQQQGEQNDEASEGEPSESEQAEGEPSEGEQQEGESGEQSEGEPQQGEQSPQDAAAERERLAQEQAQAQEEMEELQELIEQLQERMEEQRGAPTEEMQQMMEQMQQQNLPQQMQQNQQQLQQNQLQDAQQGQQQMQQQLQQMAQQMQQMAGQMSGEQSQLNMQAIRRVLDDVLTLSEEQERLADETGGLPSRSPALRPIAQQQVELAEGLAIVSDTLQALAREIPQMTYEVQRLSHDGLREMGQATERLADLQPGPASGHQKTAMTHLNDLALMLSELLNQMQQGGGGGSGMSMQQMQQQLQQMGQQQQQLNQQMQQMLNQMAGERLTESQQEQARRAAAQQEAIRQQLQELMQEGGQGLDPQTRSALQRASDQMRQIERELRGGRLSEETLQRQQNILQRLLDAERSVNQRGREERREGRTGEDEANPDRPDRLPPTDTESDRLRRDLIRALESGYAPDYQDLIKRYFERLQDRAGSN